MTSQERKELEGLVAKIRKVLDGVKIPKDAKVLILEAIEEIEAICRGDEGPVEPDEDVDEDDFV